MLNNKQKLIKNFQIEDFLQLVPNHVNKYENADKICCYNKDILDLSKNTNLLFFRKKERRILWKTNVKM